MSRARTTLFSVAYVGVVVVVCVFAIPWVVGVVFPTWGWAALGLVSMLAGGGFGLAIALWTTRRQRALLRLYQAEARRRAGL